MLPQRGDEEIVQVVLASGGPAAEKLIPDLLAEECLGFRIALVLTDRPDLYPQLTHVKIRGAYREWDPHRHVYHLSAGILTKHILVTGFHGRKIRCHEESIKAEDSPKFLPSLQRLPGPRLLISNVYGQIFSQDILEVFDLAMNLHSTWGTVWPNKIYKGPNPIGTLLEEQRRSFRVALHYLTRKVDEGPLFRLSDQERIPPGSTADDILHRRAVVASQLLRQELPLLLQMSRENWHRRSVQTEPERRAGPC